MVRYRPWLRRGVAKMVGEAPLTAHGPLWGVFLKLQGLS